MNINKENSVSISDATQDFSRVTRLADETGPVIILKNGAPRYVLSDYNLVMQNAVAEDTDVDAVASRILTKYIKAFEELAK